MTDQELDGILEEDRQVQASAKFTARVMRAVREEAATPPPLPFPWLCMLPLLLCWGLTVAAMVAAVWFGAGAPAEPAPRFHLDGWGPIAAVVQIVSSVRWVEAGWITLALVLTLVSVGYPLRLVGVGFRRS
jgi:hypothetical protein